MIINVIFSICGIILIISWLFRDIFLLRIITMMGMAVNTTGGFVAGYQTPGMEALIFFSILTFVINGYQVAKIVAGRKLVNFPDEINAIYAQNFYMMTTNEFSRIYKLASLKKFRKGEKLIVQDQTVDSVMLIKAGEVNVIKNGQNIAKLAEHYFIGEMSFFSGNMASVTVEADSDEVEIINWNKERLIQYKKKDFDLYNKVESALAINLVKKLNRGL